MARSVLSNSGGGGERRDGGGEDRCGKKNIGDLTVDPIFLRIEIVFCITWYAVQILM